MPETTMRPVREQVTWIRTWPKTGRARITHPYFWRVTEPDGYIRYFDTRQEALDWIESYA